MSSYGDKIRLKMSEEMSSPSASSPSSSSSSLSSSSKNGGQMKRQNISSGVKASALAGAGDSELLPTHSSEVKSTLDTDNGCKRRRRSGHNNNDVDMLSPHNTDCDIATGIDGAIEEVTLNDDDYDNKGEYPESSSTTNKTENLNMKKEHVNEMETSIGSNQGNVLLARTLDIPQQPHHRRLDITTEATAKEPTSSNTECSTAVHPADGNADEANIVVDPSTTGSAERTTNATSQRQCRIRQRSYRRSIPEMSSGSASPTQEEINNDNVPEELTHQSDDSDGFSIARFVLQYDSQSSESNDDDINSIPSHDLYDPWSEDDSSMEEDLVIFDDADENNGEGDGTGEPTSGSGGRKSYVFGIVNKVLSKPMSACTWNTTMEVMWREYGMFDRAGGRSAALRGHSKFNTRFYASQFVVERMKLSHCLSRHNGCVNSLNFDRSGDLLCSGSDDKRIVIWDWARNKFKHVVKSGHRENIFQTKFISVSGRSAALDIVSAGRDGQVRRAIIPSSGKAITTCLYKHRNAVHKLVICPNSPFEILSVGEDGYIRHCDLRSNANASLSLLKVVNNTDARSRVRLFSIAHHPYSPEVCVCGSDEYVLVYDKRKFDEPVHKMCPSHLANMSASQVTCCTYNYNGTEILATYSDEQIYLFDNHHYTPGSFLHVYRGHYNHRTIKGVNFFGPNSEYIISGSDCGNVFFWDKETEAIVNFMSADAGSVNCLEPHPSIPVLATSGLDYSVKVWMPGSERTAPDKEKMKSCIMRNIWRSGMERRGDLFDSAFNDIILEAFNPSVFDSDDSLSESSPIHYAHDPDNTSSSSSRSDSTNGTPSTENNDHQYHAHDSDDSSEAEVDPLNGPTCRAQ